MIYNMKNTSQIRQMIDQMIASRMDLISLSFAILGLITFFHGFDLFQMGLLPFSGSILMISGLSHIVLALITMSVGVTVWLSKSRTKTVTLLIHGCIILNIISIIYTYPPSAVLSSGHPNVASSEAIANHQDLFGLPLLGIWLVVWLIDLIPTLVRYRSKT
ncbi:MAG: hypothetical protein ACW964_03875 [Candidatus Hodarchaeales archaeon]|jgi:hypothetical protein